MSEHNILEDACEPPEETLKMDTMEQKIIEGTNLWIKRPMTIRLRKKRNKSIAQQYIYEKYFSWSALIKSKLTKYLASLFDN